MYNKKMVEIRPVINKETKKQLVSKDGRELVEYRFEDGDMFIPCYNSVYSHKNEAEIKGKKKSIVTYSLKVKAKNKEGIDFVDYKGDTEFFVTLTPTQAKSIQKKIDNSDEINQKLFVCYTYTSADYPDEEFIGVGYKSDSKPSKSFEDFEESQESQE